MAGEKRKSSRTGSFAYDGLDRVIHERARLAILSSLAANAEGLSFKELKDVCSLTDGYLRRQLQVLNDADFVEIEKGSSGNRPLTIVRLTRAGRKRFLEYIAELEKVVSNAADTRPGRSPAADGGEISPA